MISLETKSELSNPFELLLCRSHCVNRRFEYWFLLLLGLRDLQEFVTAFLTQAAAPIPDDACLSPRVPDRILSALDTLAPTILAIERGRNEVNLQAPRGFPNSVRHDCLQALLEVWITLKASRSDFEHVKDHPTMENFKKEKDKVAEINISLRVAIKNFTDYITGKVSQANRSNESLMGLASNPDTYEEFMLKFGESLRSLSVCRKECLPTHRHQGGGGSNGNAD